MKPRSVGQGGEVCRPQAGLIRLHRGRQARGALSCAPLLLPCPAHEYFDAMPLPRSKYGTQKEGWIALMVDDRPKLPRARLRDEKLYIEGEKEPYFRDRTNDVRLRIKALTIRRGYQDGKTGKVLTEYLHGIATLGERRVRCHWSRDR
jgi:hypothetical protein